MSPESGSQGGLKLIVLLGFAWSVVSPVLAETALSQVLTAHASDPGFSATMLGSWLVQFYPVVRWGLWVAGLLALIVGVLCVVRRASVCASTSAALGMALVSGSLVFLALFISAFTQASVSQ